MHVFPASFVEKMTPSPLNCLGTLVENQLTVNVRSISRPSIRFIKPLPVLMPVSPCLVYCNDARSLEIAKSESSNFVRFLKHNCVGYSGPLYFHRNFRITLSVSGGGAEASWDYSGGRVESIDKSASVCHKYIALQSVNMLSLGQDLL